MYKTIIRPILFLFSPETIHHFVINSIRFFFSIPGIQKLTKTIYSEQNKKLQRDFLGLTFSNPVGLAAGFDKDAKIYNQFRAFGFSFIEIGTVTPLPQSGNPKPRSFRLTKDKGIINRMGFNNLGVDQAVEQLKDRHPELIIGGNIGKNTQTPNEQAVNDYEICFRKLYDYVDYFVVNVSCPNITNMKELQDKDSLIKILSRIMEVRREMKNRKPVLLKISPDLNYAQIDEVIDIVKETDTDGIVATNTTITRDNLKTDKNIVAQIGRGGMSGKPIQQRSTDIIRYINQKTGGQLPIIGVGGIMSAADAKEKIDAGATLVQVYTGFIYEGPGLVRKINKGLLYN
ncbi:MAG TPA: quinone-dependent dihydroorotate dehydrogenase [Bacteroidales bacterium]|nr:quinone-dependent dihydroorotate dehydrogenase [Bacteroidales bacterium]